MTVGIQRQGGYRDIHLCGHIVVIIGGKVFGVAAHCCAQHGSVTLCSTQRLSRLTGAHHSITVAVHRDGAGRKQVGIRWLAVIVGG